MRTSLQVRECVYEQHARGIRVAVCGREQWMQQQNVLVGNQKLLLSCVQYNGESELARPLEQGRKTLRIVSSDFVRMRLFLEAVFFVGGNCESSSPGPPTRPI